MQWPNFVLDGALIGIFCPSSEDELAGAAPGALTDDSDTPSHTSTVSRVPTPALAPLLAPAKVVAKYTDADLQQAIQLALKLFVQGQQQAQSRIASPALEPRERPLKARFPDLYYSNLHMDCYRFCQQCEDHFETAKAKAPNRIPFAALFLRGLVTQRWLYHKQRHDGVAPMTWPEFKDFFRKNLGDSRAFVDGIWSKIKRDSQYQDEWVQE